MDVRWNVSGSYQQALPAYVDEDGKSVLADITDPAERMNNIFLKGYQWPFDARKQDGSSRVDRLVHARLGMGKKVYLDYRREEMPAPLSNLGDEGRTYLKNCGAMLDGPLNRLRAINEAAYRFYRDRGIDLEKEPLRIALCAQHCNGGILVDENWQTDIENLYACGECSGIYGPYRPGGSALLETQVGSLRAASAVLQKRLPALSAEVFLKGNLDGIERELCSLRAETTQDAQILAAFQARMDRDAGAVRQTAGMKALLADVEQTLAQDRLPYGLRDTLTTMAFTLSAMLCQAQVSMDAGHTVTQTNASSAEKMQPCRVHFVTRWKDGTPVTEAEPVSPLPEGGGWFETVWADFRKKRGL